ncbi:MAG: hypothetical protein ACOVP1_07130 [Bacteroidia bacterium]
MIICCPTCTTSLSIDPEQAIELLGKEINCPDCGNQFQINETKESLSFDMKLEEMKDELVIQNSLKNLARHFDDC